MVGRTVVGRPVVGFPSQLPNMQILMRRNLMHWSWHCSLSLDEGRTWKWPRSCGSRIAKSWRSSNGNSEPVKVRQMLDYSLDLRSFLSPGPSSTVLSTSWTSSLLPFPLEGLVGWGPGVVVTKQESTCPGSRLAKANPVKTTAINIMFFYLNVKVALQTVEWWLFLDIWPAFIPLPFKA